MNDFMLYFLLVDVALIGCLFIGIILSFSQTMKYKLAEEHLKLELLELKIFQMEYYDNIRKVPEAKNIFSKRYHDQVEKWILRMDTYLDKYEDNKHRVKLVQEDRQDNTEEGSCHTL